jgi:hypothetical protein
VKEREKKRWELYKEQAALPKKMQDYASHSERKKEKEIGKNVLLFLLLFSSPR